MINHWKIIVVQWHFLMQMGYPRISYGVHLTIKEQKHKSKLYVALDAYFKQIKSWSYFGNKVIARISFIYNSSITFP